MKERNGKNVTPIMKTSLTRQTIRDARSDLQAIVHSSNLPYPESQKVLVDRVDIALKTLSTAFKMFEDTFKRLEKGKEKEKEYENSAGRNGTH